MVVSLEKCALFLFASKLSLGDASLHVLVQPFLVVSVSDNYRTIEFHYQLTLCQMERVLGRSHM